MKIGIVGLGTVGEGVLKVLTNEKESIFDFLLFMFPALLDNIYQQTGKESLGTQKTQNL